MRSKGGEHFAVVCMKDADREVSRRNHETKYLRRRHVPSYLSVPAL